MGSEKGITLPKWVWIVIGTIVVSLIGAVSGMVVYIHDGDKTELKTLTIAVQQLNQTIVELKGSDNLIRVEFSSTDRELISKYTELKESDAEIKRRLEKLEGVR